MYRILISFLLIAIVFSGCIGKDMGKESQSYLDDLLVEMTIEEKVGQMVQARVIEEDGDDIFTRMPSEKTMEMIQKYHIGSVILYSTLNPEFTAEYTNRLQHWAEDTELSIPLLIAADFETGAGHNVFSGVTFFPQQMGIGATGSTRIAEDVARTASQETISMGIHWDYSPTADVNTDPSNPVIGVRSFGDDTEMVCRFVKSYVIGYQSNGLLATAKHYPGHGDTAVDSHLELPKVTYGRDELEAIHLKPFQAAIDSDVKSIMTAHIIVEAVDENYPGTLSEKILTGILRDEQGFDGIIVTDGMSMGGIAEHFGVGEASVLAVKAGADVVMATGDYEDQIATYEAILNAVMEGEIPEDRIDESVSRILKEKFALGLFEEPFVDPESAPNFVAILKIRGWLWKQLIDRLPCSRTREESFHYRRILDC